MNQLSTGAASGGASVPAVPAASTIVLRDAAPFEVLLVRRSSASSFVPDAWVFPGGSVDPIDRELAEDASEISAMRVCAHRELFEETAIWLGSIADPVSTRDRILERAFDFRSVAGNAVADRQAMVWTSRWITPKGVPKRFDTWFFVVHVPQEAEAIVDGREVVEAVWLDPAEALRSNQEGSMKMVLPTIRNLAALLDFQNIEALLESRRRATIIPVEPVIIMEGGKSRIVIQGEPG